jgi:hypothetical protein
MADPTSSGPREPFGPLLPLHSTYLCIHSSTHSIISESHNIDDYGYTCNIEYRRRRCLLIHVRVVINSVPELELGRLQPVAGTECGGLVDSILAAGDHALEPVVCVGAYFRSPRPPSTGKVLPTITSIARNCLLLYPYATTGKPAVSLCFAMQNAELSVICKTECSQPWPTHL